MLYYDVDLPFAKTGSMVQNAVAIKHRHNEKNMENRGALGGGYRIEAYQEFNHAFLFAQFTKKAVLSLVVHI